MEKGKECPHLGEDKLSAICNWIAFVSGSGIKYHCEYCLEVLSTDQSKDISGEADSKILVQSANLWVCSECMMAFCPAGHSELHFLKTSHPLVVSVHNQEVYCLSCRKMVKLASKSVEQIKEEQLLACETRDLPPQTSSNLNLRYVIRGLVNFGSTCFYNAILQNLLTMNILRDHYVALEEDRAGPIANTLGRLYQVTGPNEVSTTMISADKLFNLVCGVEKIQEDSHEFLTMILEHLQKEEIEWGKKKADEGPTFIELVFQGEVSVTVSCSACGTTSTHVDVFKGLSLPVTKHKKRNIAEIAKTLKGSVSGDDYIVNIPEIAKNLKGEYKLKAKDILPVATLDVSKVDVPIKKGFRGVDVDLSRLNQQFKKFPRQQGTSGSTFDVPVKKSSGGVDLSEIESRLTELGFYPSDEEEVDNSSGIVSVNSGLKAFTAAKDLLGRNCKTCDNIANGKAQAELLASVANFEQASKPDDIELEVDLRDMEVERHGTIDRNFKTCDDIANGKAQAQLLASWANFEQASKPDDIELEVDLRDFEVERHETIRSLIKKTPPILTIHLLRYKYLPDGVTRKIHGHIAFDATIDLGPYMEQRKDSEAGVVKYNLLGVVQHFGRMAKGKYVAYVRGGQCSDGDEDDPTIAEWYRVDDKSIEKVSLDQVLRCEAYILFYRKI